MSEEKTIFQKIIDKEIPSTTHYEDDLCIVIEDINPKAPIHLLIIPKKPIPKLSDASDEDVSILGHLMFIVGEMSRKFETEDSFNVVINNGASAGQTVFHLRLAGLVIQYTHSAQDHKHHFESLFHHQYWLM